jgi:hypothetical protein
VTFGSMAEALRISTVAENLTIVNNTLIGDQYGLRVSGSSANFSGNQVVNNIFCYTGTTGAAADGNGCLDLSGTNLSLTGTSQFGTYFNNADAADFTLKSGATGAIDTGTNAGYSYIGSAPDMGAYEYGATAWSAGANISPQALPPPRLWSVTAGAGSAALKWMPAPGSQYEVYRSDTQGYGYQKVTELNNDTLTYTNTGLTSGGPWKALCSRMRYR